MHIGPICEDITPSYNERGDISGSMRTLSGLPSEFGGHTEPPVRYSNVYEYDESGNLNSRNETPEFGEHETMHTHVRQLTYYD
jgi:hypothetical protein